MSGGGLPRLPLRALRPGLSGAPYPRSGNLRHLRREVEVVLRYNARLFVIRTDSATGIVIIADIGGAPALLAVIAAPEPD
jgi:hypothetical protein